MKNQEPTLEQKQAVKLLVASSWRAINKFGHRTETFTTNQAIIRRYFAWCQRHSLDPANENAFRVYFGTRHTERSDVPYPLSPAYVESTWGSGLNVFPNAKLTDAWRVVLQASFAKNLDDQVDWLPQKLTFTATCTYDLKSTVSPFTWKMGMSITSPFLEGRAKIEYFPRNNFISLDNIYRDLFFLKYGRSSQTATHLVSFRAQPYTYRSRRSIDLARELRFRAERSARTRINFED